MAPSRKTAEVTGFSGFADFPNIIARDEFLRVLTNRIPSLKRLARPAASRPVLVFRSLTANQLSQLQSTLKGYGTYFPDVQFHPMSPDQMESSG